jgi:CHAT domain-containing protein
MARQFAQRSAAPHPFVGIGGPTLTDPPLCRQGVAVSLLFTQFAVNVNEVRLLCSLPDAVEELRALARQEGVSPDENVYVGDRATKRTVESLPLSTYRIIAFATHGLVAGEIKNLAESALVLTPPAAPSGDDDGLLTASDITQLKLDADWVILSACNTAAGETPDAEGLSGLAKAFFYAGARSLLVSHWHVLSDAARELTVRTLAAIERNPKMRRAEALRSAEMALLDSDPEMGHPMAWAPFSLVGAGGIGQ